jgi:hypothetical protein
MILRRVIQHVKEQNWFAVGLDFLIVVLGVVIGFQVTAWNEALNDEARARGYLQRIHTDLGRDMDNYDARIAFWSAVSDHGRAAIDAVRTPTDVTRSDAENWQIVLDFFQASQVYEFVTIETAYVEVTSAGELGLIANDDIRGKIATFYSQSGNASLSERPVYRETVRGIIPVHLQLYIWDRCWESGTNGYQALLDCAPPRYPEEIAATVDRLLSDRLLHGQLRFWLSTLYVLPAIANDRLTDAVALSDAIAAELGTTP